MKNNCFHELDVGGQRISFKYNKESLVKTTPGACISFMFYIFVCYYISYEIYYFYLNPFKQEYIVETVLQPKINLKDYENFMMMSCKVDAINNNISKLPQIDEIVEETLKLNLIYRIPKYVRQKVKLKIKPCKRGMFPGKIVTKRLYEQLYQDCKCVPHESLRDYNMSFFFSDSYFTFLEYSYKYKDEVFNNKTRLQEAYDLLLKAPTTTEFFFVDTSAEEININHPFKFYFNTQLNFLNPDFVIYSDIWLKKIQMTLSDSILTHGKCNIYA